MGGLVPRLSRLKMLFLIMLGHLALLAWFHTVDRRLPDGDELGHILAAEGVAHQIADQGFAQTWVSAWAAGGDYPPLYALLLGTWATFFPRVIPFPGNLDLLNTLIFLVSLGLVFILGRRSGGERVGLMAALFWSLLPLVMAMAHFTMPESLLTLELLLLTLALDGGRGFSTWKGSLQVGLALLVGLLTKQTFAVYAAAVVAPAWWQGWRRGGMPSVKGTLVALIVALPLPLLWASQHRDTQWTYLTTSAANTTGASVVDHLLYYPLVLVGSGLGLIWSTLFLLVLLLSRGGIHLRPLRGGWGWMLLILTLIPKKYPRLVLPVLPLLAVELARLVDGLSPSFRRRLLLLAPLVMLQVAVLVPGLPLPSSRAGLWYPHQVVELDPNCFQDWIRPAHSGSQGFERVYEALRDRLGEDIHEAPPGKGWVVALNTPPIPCTYQTTFGYTVHLRHFLRWHGLEQGEIPDLSQDPDTLAALDKDAVQVVISTTPWRCEQGGPLCEVRNQFGEVGQFYSDDEELPFRLHIYGRHP